MIRIGLISDTHNFFDDKIYKYFKNVDEVWHAGDIGNIEILKKIKNFKKTRAVYGNIDGYDIRNECKKELLFTIYNFKIFITHIGGKPLKYNNDIIKKINGYEPDIFVCGHSHILNISKDKKFNLIFMNPGAAGKVGLNKERTIVRFGIDEKKINSIEVIKL